MHGFKFMKKNDIMLVLDDNIPRTLKGQKRSGCASYFGAQLDDLLALSSVEFNWGCKWKNQELVSANWSTFTLCGPWIFG